MDCDCNLMSPDKTALLSLDCLALWGILSSIFFTCLYIVFIYKGFLEYVFLHFINELLFIYFHSRFRPLNAHFRVHIHSILLFQFYFQNLLTSERFYPTYFVVILNALCVCIIDCNFFFTPLLLRYVILLFVCMCIVLQRVVIVI